MLLNNAATYKQPRQWKYVSSVLALIFYFGFPLTQLDSFCRTFSQTKNIFKINFAKMKQK